MIGQNIGLRHLVPLAIERLDRDPLVAGDLYPGDLICNVLTLPAEFWRAHPSLLVRLTDIANRAADACEAAPTPDGKGPPAEVAVRIRHFRGRRGT